MKWKCILAYIYSIKWIICSACFRTLSRKILPYCLNQILLCLNKVGFESMRSRFMVLSAFFRLLMEKLCNVISSVIDILLYLLTPNIFLLYFKYPVKICHFYSSPALVVLSVWSHYFFFCLHSLYSHNHFFQSCIISW